MRALDLFAGPGGWDVGAGGLGIQPLGVEYDDDACATRKAAGHPTLQGDVAALDPRHVLDEWAGVEGADLDLLIASPPCQAWSMAGHRKGEEDIESVYALTDHLVDANGWAEPEWADERSRLVTEPLRWTLALRPSLIALEQVPPVIDYWRRVELILRDLGYSTWTGVLSAERYGVPQTRKRAILLASLVGPVEPPRPTHQRYVPGEPPRAELTLEGEILPWVSMSEALGWAARGTVTSLQGNADYYGGKARRPTGAPSRTVDSGTGGWVATDTQGGWQVRDSFGEPQDDYDGREDSRWKGGDRPSPTVDTKARDWQVRTAHFTGDRVDGERVQYERPADAPAPTVAPGVSHWEVDRPSPTIMAGNSAGQFGASASAAIREAAEPTWDWAIRTGGGFRRVLEERPSPTVKPSISSPGFDDVGRIPFLPGETFVELEEAKRRVDGFRVRRSFGERERENPDHDYVPGDHPAPTVDGATGSWEISTRPPRPNAAERNADEPAPTLTSGGESGQRVWVDPSRPHSAVRREDEPAPTVHVSKLNDRRWLDQRQTGARPRPDDEPAPTQTSGSLSHGVGVWTDQPETTVGKTQDEADKPAPTVTGTRRSDQGMLIGRQLPEGEGRNVGGKNWVEEQPATTVQGDPRIFPPGHFHRNDEERGDWTEGRPATTVAGDERVFPGPRDERNHDYQPGDPPVSQANDGNAVRVTIEQASVLQGFAPDYPWRGARTKRFQQIGNAVPPPLARAILAALTGAS